MTELSKERREELKQSIADDEVRLDEPVDETGTIYPHGMTYGELSDLLDMADERVRYRELLSKAQPYLTSLDEYDVVRKLCDRIYAALEGKES